MGYFPFPGIESVIVVSSGLSLSFKECKKFFKILHFHIYQKMYDFDHNN